jgi:glyceraldehyde 3-phosphate dehydrogenase
VLPKLKGKLKGISMRVPVANGSIVDLVVQSKKKATRASVNSALKRAAKGKMKGIIEYSEDELVSSDVIGNKHSAVVDSLSTEVNGDLIKVLAWYDNEFGYSSRLVDVIQKIEKLG